MKYMIRIISTGEQTDKAIKLNNIWFPKSVIFTNGDVIHIPKWFFKKIKHKLDQKTIIGHYHG